ncbi:MAG: hypothetical protein JWO08_1172 [Verrucomicrobiaceae bacterium]|nr:hypothetical protein [Verrucomicrobiaceae bacterium]
MISGPLPIGLVAHFLGKDVREMRALIDEEGLPTLPVNSLTKPVYKVYFTPLLSWINQRATGHPMTAEQLEAELSRCQQAQSAKKEATKKKGTKK